MSIDGGIQERGKDNVVDATHSLRGYPRLAEMMTRSREAMIFRRFNSLTTLNILRLQAELQDLEQDLYDILSEDDQSGDVDRRRYCEDFALMRTKFAKGMDSTQIEHLEKIDRKLEQYSLAVTNAVQLARVQSPTQREIDFLRIRLDQPASVGGAASFLIDNEAEVWHKKNDPDLMSLYPTQLGNDSFTRLLNGFLLDMYHRLWGSRKDAVGYREYSDEKLARITKVVGAVVSSALPTLTVLVLFFVHSLLIRIGLVIVFTALFSVALSLFTSADMATIFTSTATFAAVEVVFVGTATIGGNKNG